MLLTELALTVLIFFTEIALTVLMFVPEIALTLQALIDWLASDQNSDASFTCDPMEIVWERYLENFCYGLRRWVLLEDVIPLSDMRWVKCHFF
jgi:hypothetical protein